jgi:hypothetical protein
MLRMPFEVVLAFGPWSFSLVLLFWHRQLSPQNRLYSAVIGVNLIIYWLSPETTMRYILPIIPFLFAISLECWEQIWQKYHPEAYLKLIWRFLLWGSFASILIKSNMEGPKFIISNHGYWPVLLISGLIVANILPRGLFRRVCGTLVVVRIFYSIFLLPERTNQLRPLKDQALELAQKVGAQPLCLFEKSWLHDASTYYISRSRHKILPYCSAEESKGSYVIIDDMYLAELGETSFLMELGTRNRSDRLKVVMNPL